MITLIMSSSSLSTVIKEEERSGLKNNAGVIFDDRFTFDFNYGRNLSLDPRSRFKNNTGVTGAGAPPPPPPLLDDLRFSNTTGILKKKKNYVVYWC